ncbi:UDP-glucose 4-epimerase family protein [Stutzerimonas stutzeri]|uniref:UDP-glucose 4-epimerase family protein n=1 Tax=Stutzerimonas stutzeri TaxID=316 RepID=UPI00210D8191|nr:SDR family oxidoreductase [Stutzerimonas stutzeri]MCQ4322425.1 SDR family oxidoreductase [Stutzerimonas stutzeri]
MKSKILVTGGTGFVGGALLRRLVTRPDVQVLAWIRRVDSLLPVGVVPVPVSLNRTFAAGTQVEGVDTVVHCAARVHVMQDHAADPLAEFRKVNVEGTLELARSAVASGARRFIFISSIKVNGEATLPGRPFAADDVSPPPADPYAQSKFEAESGLRALAAETGMEVVIIRTPLVYGPGVKGNFRSMMRWLMSGVPLPLGDVGNKRSLIAVDNLVDLIVTCIEHPAAANETLLAADGEDLSTTDLLRRLASALGTPVRLMPIPVARLEAVAGFFGKRAAYDRLCGSLQVDISKTRSLLGWSPPVGMDEALRKTATDYLQRRHT